MTLVFSSLVGCYTVFPVYNSEYNRHEHYHEGYQEYRGNNEQYRGQGNQGHGTQQKPQQSAPAVDKHPQRKNGSVGSEHHGHHHKDQDDRDGNKRQH